jgi:hypothetical protein
MGRSRVLKFALLFAAALVAAGVLALRALIDREASAPELKSRVEQAASEFLGRPVTIESIEWRRRPQEMLIGTNVRLYEDSLKQRLAVDAPRVEAPIAVLSLFKLAAGITELRFISPRITLRRDKRGVWNAERIVDEISARPDEPDRRWGTLAFNWFVIQGGTVTVEDEAGRLGELPPIDVEGSGKLRFGRRRIHFPFKLTGRLEGSSAAVELAGDLGGRTRFSVEMKDADPSLARLEWGPAASWTGRWNGRLGYDELPETHWNLHVRAASLVVSTSAPRLDSLDVAGDYISASSAAFTVVARSSTTELEVRGSLRDRAIDLDARSPRADLGVLAALGRAAAAAAPNPSPKAPSSAPPWTVSARISVDDLQYDQIELKDVRAVVQRSTGAYTLESLALRSLGGSLQANGAYLPSAGDEALRFSWKASSMSVQDIVRLAGSTRDAGGVADSEGSVVTGAGDRFLPAMSGAVKVDVKNGWTAMPGLLKVLSRLNISSLFAEVSGRGAKRLPYDEAHAAVRIANGKVSSEKPLMLENKTLQMAFMGTYDLPAGTVNGKIVVNFLTVTDEIIGLIPGVREILLGKEKGLIPIWVEVKGNAADPEIRILSARTIAGPVWNTLGHILRLPKTLFQELKPPKPAKP